MEFTLYFVQVFFLDLLFAGPVLVFLFVLIGFIGSIIGRIEGWSISDALYYAFITATTVGYGDFRPTKKRAKMFAIVLAFVGLVFTGMVVAIALHAADYAYGEVFDASGFRNRLGE